MQFSHWSEATIICRDKGALSFLGYLETPKAGQLTGVTAIEGSGHVLGAYKYRGNRCLNENRQHYVTDYNNINAGEELRIIWHIPYFSRYITPEIYVWSDQEVSDPIIGSGFKTFVKWEFYRVLEHPFTFFGAVDEHSGTIDIEIAPSDMAAIPGGKAFSSAVSRTAIDVGEPTIIENGQAYFVAVLSGDEIKCKGISRRITGISYTE